LHLTLVYAVELYPELGYYRKVIGVEVKTAVNPTLVNTFPAGYQHMVNLLPGVMVARDPGEVVYVFSGTMSLLY